MSLPAEIDELVLQLAASLTPSQYDAFVIAARTTLAGIPCMSVPCGNTSDGLPVGLQILCKHFAEPTMFRLADAFECAN